MVHLGSPSKAMALEVCSLLPVTHTDPALCWLREMPPLRCLLSHGFKWLLVPRGLQFPAQFSLSFLRRPLGFWEWKNGEQGDIFILLRNPNPPAFRGWTSCPRTLWEGRSWDTGPVDARDHVHWDKTVSLNISLSNKTWYFPNTLPGDACFVSPPGVGESARTGVAEGVQLQGAEQELPSPQLWPLSLAQDLPAMPESFGCFSNLSPCAIGPTGKVNPNSFALCLRAV